MVRIASALTEVDHPGHVRRQLLDLRQRLRSHGTDLRQHREQRSDLIPPTSTAGRMVRRGEGARRRGLRFDYKLYYKFNMLQ